MGCLSVIVGFVVFLVASEVWDNGGIGFIVASLTAAVVYAISKLYSKGDERQSTPTISSRDRRGVTFRNIDDSPPVVSTQTDLKDVNDAFTGAPIDARLAVYQCTRCKVYYQKSSVDFLRTEAAGKCVSCQGIEIVQVGLTGSRATGHNYNAGVVTLSDYRLHVDQVVTFRGVVVKTYYTRYGHNLALMFEDLPLRRAFKMIVFARYIQEAGGTTFLESLRGKTVQVRGLLQRHATWGYELVLTHRRMILEIE